MSTATEAQIEGEIEIPGDDEVKTQSGGKAWRFSKGRIVRGREEDGSFETRESITGIIVRKGFYRGTVEIATQHGKVQKPIYKVEADIKVKGGEIVHVGCDLLDDDFNVRPTMAAIKFAWGLTQFGARDVIRIEASKGESWIDPKTGKTRDGSTYVNWFRVENGNAILHKQPARAKNAPSQSTSEKWAEMRLEELLRADPLYKEREKRESNSATSSASGPAFEAFCNLCRKAGWPTPEQAANEWLSVFAQIMKANPPATLGHISEAEWDAASKGMKAKFDSNTPPKAIAEAKARLEATQQAALGDDYDPFKDVE